MDISGTRYCLNIPNVWTDYLQNLPSSSFRKKLQRSYQRFIALPESKYTVLTTGSEIMDKFPKLIRLHQSSWQKKGKSGAFYCEEFTSFHHQLIEKISHTNNVSLLVIEVKNQIIAVFYFFMDKDCCYYYQSGIDKAFRPNISPGILGHSLMIQYCIEHNIKSYDFMMGASSGSYKSMFDTEKTNMFEIRMIRKNMLGFFIQLLKFRWW